MQKVTASAVISEIKKKAIEKTNNSDDDASDTSSIIADKEG